MNMTITVTFGEQAENHKGMQVIGNLMNQGFTCSELDNIKNNMLKCNLNVNIYDLNENLENEIKCKVESSKILVIKNGVDFILSQNFGKFKKEDLLNELLKLNYDKQAFMYGRVVNKHARHNLCFSDFEQIADIQNKKGTVIKFNTLPILNKRDNLPLLVIKVKIYKVKQIIIMILKNVV